MQAVHEVDAPVILQLSPGVQRYAGEGYLRHLVQAAVERHPDIAVVLHQHHGTTPSECLRAIRAGFTSVMIDSSLHQDGKTPSDLSRNIELTYRVCQMAHAVGVSVEVELGGVDTQMRASVPEDVEAGVEAGAGCAIRVTDPQQAHDFVAQTEVDALAIAIGTSHGAHRFTRKPAGDTLAIHRIAEIHARLPGTHLVIHGCSSIPKEWLVTIRQHGGEWPDIYGVPVEEAQHGILNGVRKINIDTDIRLAMTGALRRYLVEQPGGFDPRGPLADTRRAARDIAKARFEAFGSAGRGSGIRPTPLDAMARRYH